MNSQSNIKRERSTKRRSPHEVGQEGEGVDIGEEEMSMKLGKEREDSASITREIGNPVEEIITVEANETPRSKKTALKPVA